MLIESPGLSRRLILCKGNGLCWYGTNSCQPWPSSWYAFVVSWYEKPDFFGEKTPTRFENRVPFFLFLKQTGGTRMVKHGRLPHVFLGMGGVFSVKYWTISITGIFIEIKSVVANDNTFVWGETKSLTYQFWFEVVQ